MDITKRRILYIYQYLMKNTDAAHLVATTDIATMLKEKHDVTVSRNTLTDDMKTLLATDPNIRKIASTSNFYYYEDSSMETIDAMILLQGLQELRYIHPAKKKKVMNTVLGLISESDAEVLKHQVKLLNPGKKDEDETVEPVEVELLYDLSAITEVRRFFDQDFVGEVVDQYYSRAKILTCVDASFFHWLFSMEGRVKLLGPEDVCDRYSMMLAAAMADMEVVESVEEADVVAGNGIDEATEAESADDAGDGAVCDDIGNDDEKEDPVRDCF